MSNLQPVNPQQAMDAAWHQLEACDPPCDCMTLTGCKPEAALPAGDVFYVIEDGTFTIFKVEGQELARVSKGSCFGELALLRQVGWRSQSHALQPASSLQ